MENIIQIGVQEGIFTEAISILKCSENKRMSRNASLHERYVKGEKLKDLAKEFGLSEKSVYSENKMVENRLHSLYVKMIRAVKKNEVLEEVNAELRVNNKNLLDRLTYFDISVDPNENLATLKTKILDLNLSVRAFNCLKAGGIRTLFDLTQKTRSEFDKFLNNGKKTQTEVLEMMELYQIRFSEK